MKHAKPKPITPRKLGPGEYLPDTSQEIERVEDLPQRVYVAESRNYE